MSLYAALRNNPRPSMHEIEECFDGNLCRCTGYRPILDAAKTFAVDHPSQMQADAAAGGSGGCCGGGDCASGSASASAGDSGCGMADCCQRGIAAPTDPAVLADDAAAAASAAANADVSVRKLVRSCSCTKGRGYGPLPAAAYGATADSESEKEADAETELIFPPALALHHARALTLSGSRGVTWLRPVSLLQLLRIKQRWGQAAKIVQVCQAL
jgi:xanthine dehydrogenase/oxidase